MSNRRFKKITAIITAAAMIFTMNTVAFADVPSSTSAKGSGDVDYVDTKTPIYVVTLPTNVGLDFILDPQGLMSMKDGTTASLNSLKGGTIVMKKNNGAVFKNASSVSVNISANMTVSQNSHKVPVRLVTASEDVVPSGVYSVSNNIMLAVIPNKTKSISLNDFASTGYGVPIDGTISANGAGSAFDVNFILNKADYVVSYNAAAAGNKYSYIIDSAEENNYDGTTFKLGGYVNTKADWSTFVGTTPTSSVEIAAVYSVNPVGKNPVANADTPSDGTKGYGLSAKDATKAKTVPAVAGTAETPTVLETSIASATYSRTSTANKFAITWASSMTAENKTITSITLGTDGTTFATPVPAACYSLSEDKGTLTINGTTNSAIGAGGVGNTRYLKVTFGDSSTAVLKLTNITT